MVAESGNACTINHAPTNSHQMDRQLVQILLESCEQGDRYIQRLPLTHCRCHVLKKIISVISQHHVRNSPRTGVIMMVLWLFELGILIIYLCMMLIYDQLLMDSIKPLRKSACIILLLPNAETPKQPFKTLMLKRKSGMSFPNMYAPPGGVCDPEDVTQAVSDDFYEYGKISALRELLEETGILLYPPNQKPTVTSAAYLSQKQAEICGRLKEIWSGSLHLIRPVLRLLTPQFPNTRRYDCIFYTVVIGEDAELINFKNPTAPKLTIQSLILSKQECDDGKLESPQGFLKLAKNPENQVSFAPPQIILLSCLCNIRGSQDLPTCVPSPILFEWEVQDQRRVFLLPGDEKYNDQQVLNNEPASSSKDDLMEHLKSIKERGIRRIIGNMFESNQQQNTILNRMKRQNPKL